MVGAVKNYCRRGLKNKYHFVSCFFMQEDDIQESKYIPMYYFQNRFVYSFHILNHTALHLINEVYSLSPLKKYIKNTLCPKMYFVDFDTILCIGLLYCISGHNSVHFYYNVLRPSQKVNPGPGLSQGLSQNNEPEPYKKPRLGPLSITNANRRIFFTKQITDAVPYFSLEDILNKVCHEKKRIM